MGKHTIFYINSMGFLAQWTGFIVDKTDSYISIRFAKNKVLKFDLKGLDIDLCLVTKNVMKPQGLSVLENVTASSFNDELKAKVLKVTENNVMHLWSGGKWQKL